MATIDRPIIIIGAPRSGTTILFRCLALHRDLWHLEGESHGILENDFHPREKNYESNRCTARDLTCKELSQTLYQQFYDRALNLNEILKSPECLLTARSVSERSVSKVIIATLGHLSKIKKPPVIRFLEKTPKNALRVSFLDRLFPDALFIWNKRQADGNIDSLISGWLATDRIGFLEIERFARSGYPILEYLQLKDYFGKRWKFALVPDWQSLKGQCIADVATWQYFQCNRLAMMDLAELPKERVFSLRHEDFIGNPVEWIRRILDWADLPKDSQLESFAERLPKVNDVLSDVKKESGLRYETQVQAAMERNPDLISLQKLMGYYSSRHFG